MKTVAYISILALIAFLFTTVSTGCKKDTLFSTDALEFSMDTVVFDTVFTTVGSATRRFKVYNRSNRPVKISTVHLLGGDDSPFRFNFDGLSGNSFEDITIPRNDSLFGFVEVTLDPSGQNLPLIVEDEIEFVTNNKTQNIVLAAWGQDAYFHYNDVNEGVWPNDKPHVIYGFAAVDSAKSLTIQAGTQIHLHNNSLLFVFKGALQIEGTQDDKVVIQGDRLEPFYKDVRGQYYGVYFQEALPSSIEHAIIKNGTAGIHVFSEAPSNTGYTLTIRNTELYNHASYGVFNYDGGKIYGENVLVHNVNLYAFFQLEGGSYNFRHCNFLGYGTDGNQPAVAIRNYFTRSDGITYIGQIEEGSIYNSVIYGNNVTQLAYDTITQGGAVTINYDYSHNLIRMEEPLLDDPNFNDVIWNLNPQFKNVSEQNFKLFPESPLIDNASPLYSLPLDILGRTRSATTPTIGVYEGSE